jgi:recombination associated protein RdgC
MQLLDKVRKTEFLGREFLLWLWFRSETEEGIFDLGDKGKAELWFEGKITLQSENERGVETVTCAGEAMSMKEARFALAGEKEIRQATITLTVGDNRWSFVLDSTWMNFRSFKTPRVMNDKKEDSDGLFYEKAFLIEEAVSAMDQLYSSFIRRRLSPEWLTEERRAIARWMRQGATGGVTQPLSAERETERDG